MEEWKEPDYGEVKRDLTHLMTDVKVGVFSERPTVSCPVAGGLAGGLRPLRPPDGSPRLAHRRLLQKVQSWLNIT